MDSLKNEVFEETELPKVDSEKPIKFNFWGHLSEEEQIRAAAFDKRKSELTIAFNKLFEDFGMKKPQKVLSLGIGEDGRFHTATFYESWSDSLK